MAIRISISVPFALAMTAGLLGGCGAGNNQSAGISTASLLDGKSAAGSAEVGSLATIKPDEPAARSVQVAWTAARAQKCGYNFDAAKLRATYLATEARDGAQGPQLQTFEKTYDTTFATVSNNIKSDDNYCSDRRTASIKSDLQRHLTGNYQPNLPKQKVAGGSFWDFLKTDQPEEKWEAKNFWADSLAKKEGAKGAQRVGD